MSESSTTSAAAHGSAAGASPTTFEELTTCARPGLQLFSAWLTGDCEREALPASLLTSQAIFVRRLGDMGHAVDIYLEPRSESLEHPIGLRAEDLDALGSRYFVPSPRGRRQLLTAGLTRPRQWTVEGVLYSLHNTLPPSLPSTEELSRRVRSVRFDDDTGASHSPIAPFDDAAMERTDQGHTVCRQWSIAPNSKKAPSAVSSDSVLFGARVCRLSHPASTTWRRTNTQALQACRQTVPTMRLRHHLRLLDAFLSMRWSATRRHRAFAQPVTVA